MFVVEMLGASTTLLYGLNLVWRPVNESPSIDEERHGLTKVRWQPQVAWPCSTLGTSLGLGHFVEACQLPAALGGQEDKVLAAAPGLRQRAGQSAFAERDWPMLCRVAGCLGSLASPAGTSCMCGLQLASLRPMATRACTLWRRAGWPSRDAAHTQALHPYHIRVLIPTYKETLEIVAKTVHAAYNAPLPSSCLRTIYVCDDGKDASKRKWCALRLCPCRSCLRTRRCPGASHMHAGWVQ